MAALAKLVEFQWGSGWQDTRYVDSVWIVTVKFVSPRGNEASFFAFRGVLYYRCWCWTRRVYCYWGVNLSFTGYAWENRLQSICLIDKGQVSIWYESYYRTRDYLRV